MQRLLGLHALGRVSRGLLGLLTLGLEVLDELLERVLGTVEDQLVGQLALVLGDLRVWGDVVRVDHRQVEPGLDAVMQEDRVQDRAGGGRDAEGDVRDAQAGLDARDLLLDPADALDRLDGGRLPLVVARGECEGERVEDQGLGLESMLGDQVADALGDLDLALGRLRHALLVDRQGDQAGAMFLRQRGDTVELVRACLEVDRVDDRAAGDVLQRGLDHLRLGRVDLDRGGLGQRDAFDDGAHLLVLVLALGQRDADVQHVGAAGDLVLGDLEQAVVVVGQ